MSISRISSTGVTFNSETRLKWTTLIITFVLSVSMLSVLDLLAFFLRAASLSNYPAYVLTDLILTVLGLVTCSDLVVSRGRESVKSFLVYALLSWAYITLIRFCQL